MPGVELSDFVITEDKTVVDPSNAEAVETEVAGRIVYAHEAGDVVRVAMTDARNPIHFAITAQGLVKHLAAL